MKRAGRCVGVVVRRPVEGLGTSVRVSSILLACSLQLATNEVHVGGIFYCSVEDVHVGCNYSSQKDGQNWLLLPQKKIYF